MKATLLVLLFGMFAQSPAHASPWHRESHESHGSQGKIARTSVAEQEYYACLADAELAKQRGMNSLSHCEDRSGDFLNGVFLDFLHAQRACRVTYYARIGYHECADQSEQCVDQGKTADQGDKSVDQGEKSADQGKTADQGDKCVDQIDQGADQCKNINQINQC